MNIEDLRNCCSGKDIVICGAGPSLNMYTPIEGAVHIALNRAILKKEIHFNYMVSVDYTAICSIKKQIYEAKDMIKIFGSVKGPGESVIPNEFYKMDNVIRFDVSDDIDSYLFDGELTADISSCPLRYYQSVAVTALQIALYMRPAKIYLVGLDFSDEDYFTIDDQFEENGDKHKMWAREHWKKDNIFEFWKYVSMFAKSNYPETAILSVNPVSLKGIFADIYTDKWKTANSNKVLAYIPVKKISTRLPGKNILPFGDSNLLIHKIRQLKNVKGISNIVVSTDSVEMMKMAEKEGVECIRRPDDLADESRPYADYIQYLCNVLNGEHIMRCPVTAPLCPSQVYQESIEIYFNKLNENYDSLTSVVRFQHHMMDDNGPLNFTTGIQHKGSQNLPVWYLIANCMDIEPKEIMKKHLFQYGTKVYKYEVNAVFATDIDVKEDYDIACAIYKYWQDKKV